MGEAVGEAGDRLSRKVTPRNVAGENVLPRRRKPPPPSGAGPADAAGTLPRSAPSLGPSTASVLPILSEIPDPLPRSYGPGSPAPAGLARAACGTGRCYGHVRRWRRCCGEVQPCLAAGVFVVHRTDPAPPVGTTTHRRPWIPSKAPGSRRPGRGSNPHPLGLLSQQDGLSRPVHLENSAAINGGLVPRARAQDTSGQAVT